jgi:hypothetical protein
MLPYLFTVLMCFLSWGLGEQNVILSRSVARGMSFSSCSGAFVLEVVTEKAK